MPTRSYTYEGMATACACCWPVQAEASSQELLGDIAYNQVDYYKAGRRYDKALGVLEELQDTQRCAIVAYMVSLVCRDPSASIGGLIV